MTRRPGTGGTRRQAWNAASPASGLDRLANASGFALSADLGRSLRLPDDDGRDRLMKAAIEEVRRHGRDVPDGSAGAGRPTERPGPTKSPRTKTGASDRAAAVTPGQERLILAALEAGLRPAAIAREFRLSRPTVQHVVTGAQRDRRKTERWMVQRHVSILSARGMARRAQGHAAASRRSAALHDCLRQSTVIAVTG